MLIVTDQQAFRVRGERRLARAREAEEDSRVLAFLIRVCRAMHSSDALERQEVVHHGEHALLHLTAIPGVDDDLLAARQIEDNRRIGMETKLLEVLDFRFGSIVYREVRLEVCQLLFRRFYEHVRNKVSLPSNLNDEAYSHARILVGAAESIDNIELLVGELFLGDFFASFPSLFRRAVVIVMISLRIPPNGVMGGLIIDDEFIFWGTAREDTRLDVYCTELRNLADFKTSQTFFGLFLEQRLIRRVVKNFRRARDSILSKIDVCHFTFNLFHKMY